MGSGPGGGPDAARVGCAPERMAGGGERILEEAGSGEKILGYNLRVRGRCSPRRWWGFNGVGRGRGRGRGQSLGPCRGGGVWRVGDDLEWKDGGI